MEMRLISYQKCSNMLHNTEIRGAFCIFCMSKIYSCVLCCAFVIIMSIYKCLSNTHLNLIIIKLDEQVERPKTIASFIIDRLLMYLNVCGV